jgi:uncharacterized membrane protein YkoI
VQTELKNGPVQEVQSVERNGRTVYEVTFKKPDGGNKVIYLESDGSYYKDQNSTPQAQPASTPSRRVELSQLPEPVRRTIGTESANGPVARIEQSSNNGQPMYAVFFRQNSGNEKVIYLNPDGTYVHGAGAATEPGTKERPRASWDALNGGSARPVSRQPLSSSEKVSLDKVPKAVRHAFQNEAGTAPIESIDRGTLNGNTVYEAAFKQGGETVKLRVTPDGAILPDAEDRRILSQAPLLEAKPVELRKLPAAAQNTIRSEAGNAPPEVVQVGKWNGQTVFEANINRNGQPVQLRVNAAGAVVSSSQSQSSFRNPQP